MCVAAFVEHDDVKRRKHTHIGERPCKCEVCDASTDAFCLSYDQRKHMPTYTGEATISV